MDIYSYHPVTGALLGATKADPNPIVPGDWLIPAFATAAVPPVAAEGEVIIWNGDAWAVQLQPPPLEVGPETPPPVIPPVEPQPPVEPPPPTDVSFWQFMMAAWKLNFITHAEALAAVQSRIMPPAFALAIADLPAEAQMDAELKFAGITRMLRSDPMFMLVVAANIATDEQIDGVFAVAAAIA
ncbi:MAG: hypothetical protein INF79_19285 [Roseomonas sp.]|nr:hypothetical protein [Roseomonas sp.]